MKEWKQVFTENYEGRSEEAKALQPFLKENYKGDVYIPWAVIERLTYMSDPDAKFTVMLNDHGGLVHTDYMENEQINVQKGEIISQTKAIIMSHTVRIALEYMGKLFIEDYPIQDTDYTPAKVFNQNLVNRALQRAKAKVAARGTGLGLKLYEGMDLQFDAAPEKPKPSVSKAEPIKEPPKKKVADTDSAMPVFKKIIQTMHDAEREKLEKALQRLNPSLLKSYDFTITLLESEAEMIEKLSKLGNPNKFLTSLENFLK